MRKHIRLPGSAALALAWLAAPVVAQAEHGAAAPSAAIDLDDISCPAHAELLGEPRSETVTHRGSTDEVLLLDFVTR